MKNLKQMNTGRFAVLIAVLFCFSCKLPEASAQNYNDNYNNNQGYNDQGNSQQGYNDQGYNNQQGYNDQQGYNNQGYNDQNYNNNGYNNDYSNSYNNGYSYDNGDYREFYNDLAPYGQWLSDPQYGYVWTPYNVGRGFRPYFDNGYWVMTVYGNTWVSNYPWGWAAFHYGRWAQSNYYGWVWIPGNTWGPAWVNWRQGGGYYGWAPMGPGISISISFGSGYNVPNPWWTFIPYGNIYARDYSRYYSPRQTVNIINNTTIINNTYIDNGSHRTYVTGPRRSDIETAARIKVPVYQVNNSTTRGATQLSGQKVSIYRPAINRVSATEQARFAPTQVKKLETSVVTNPGGGRAPVRNQIMPQTNGQAPKGNVNVRPDNQVIQQQNSRVSPNPQTKINQSTLQQPQRVQQGNAPQQNLQQQQQIVRQQQQAQQAQQAQQQRVQQQAQQQRMQQQQQVQQQQAQQQRVQQQQVQQQQAQQQQRIQQQQQLQQQRAQQMQQQQMQQRAQQAQQQQMQQQRVQQQQMQQRTQQVQQQRVQQPQMQQRAPQAAPKTQEVERR